jgi:hypothetical protein
VGKHARDFHSNGSLSAIHGKDEAEGGGTMIKGYNMEIKKNAYKKYKCAKTMIIFT